jgi:Spy/CpxP family protein refolding chaperone
MKRLVIAIACLILLSCEVWAQAVPKSEVPSVVLPQLQDLSKEITKQVKKDAALAAQYQGTLHLYGNTQSQYNRLTNPASSGDPLAALQVAPGTWWNNSENVTRLGLTKEQQKKMDDIFQQYRLKLIDLNASLAKEELVMTPLIESEKLDEVRIVAQIDKIAQARAELEKANSRMLLGIRQTLTMEQWSKIQSSPRNFKFTVGRQF